MSKSRPRIYDLIRPRRVLNNQGLFQANTALGWVRKNVTIVKFLTKTLVRQIIAVNIPINQLVIKHIPIGNARALSTRERGRLFLSNLTLSRCAAVCLKYYSHSSQMGCEIQAKLPAGPPLIYSLLDLAPSPAKGIGPSRSVIRKETSYAFSLVDKRTMVSGAFDRYGSQFRRIWSVCLCF